MRGTTSFLPEEELSRLRANVRQRQMLIQYRSLHAQQMNLELTTVMRDIPDQIGMQIIRSILAGERDSEQLDVIRDYGCKQSEEEIAKSLQGYYREEHVFALRQAMELCDVYNVLIAACDEEKILAVIRQRLGWRERGRCNRGDRGS